MKIAVITISDRAYTNVYPDKSGPEIELILKKNIENITIERIIVPDNRKMILKALKKHKHCNFIITTGGTGISERDITPEVCRKYCSKELPGISETLRARSYIKTPNAMLSRGYAGIRKDQIIINFPGSVKAVQTCTNIIIPIMEHSISMTQGKGH
jgi:molybdopterin adenylyltransferase